MDELIRRLTNTLKNRYFNNFRLYEFSTAMGAIWMAAREFAVANKLDPNEAQVAATVIAVIAAVLYSRNPKTLEWAADETTAPVKES